MSSYNQNIERLKSAANFNTSRANAYETESARQSGAQGIQDARAIATGLSDFSTQLKQWKEEDIKKQKEVGKIAAQEAATENAQKRAELALEMKDAQDKDTEYFQQLKAEMLKLSGPDVYPEADRLAKLSPWAQVGYASEKLRVFNTTFDDKLAYMMQNSDQAITIQGMTFTPKELRENNITGLPFKEAAIQAMSEQIKREAGIHKFSPEMLSLAKTNDAIQMAKDGQMEKFRERYNIDASMQTRAQALLEWQRSEKTAADLYRFLLVNSATVNDKNQVLGNVGGWNVVMNQLVKEGIAAGGDTGYADTIGDLPIPPILAKQLGIKPGTTFKEHWPQKFIELKRQIKKGYVETVNAEEDFLKAQQTEVGNQFNRRAQTGEIDGDELEQWKEKSRRLGGVLDTRIKNYETLSARDQRRDEDAIEDLIASNNGYITNEQLNSFHPRAAAKYREQATRHENAFKKTHRVDEKIKSALNQSWEEAGMKSKEKPVIWEYALARAQQDYERKFNRLVAMGFDADTASKFALDAPAGTVKHPESGEPILDFQGVVNEIQTNGAKSQYTRDGTHDKESIADAMIRVHEIDIAKKEMLSNPFAVRTKILGGSYGQDRLNEIIKNMETYGPWEGIIKSDLALKYYQGLALGKRGWNAHSIIDAQLKAAGHPGLFPDREEPNVTEEEDNGATEEVANIIEVGKHGGSLIAYNNIIDSTIDLENISTGQPSVWNQPENLPGYLV